jgi:hypothetical protein
MVRKNKINSILILAAAFEKKVKSLVSNQETPLLIKQISSQFNINPTKDQWESWLATNATVLGNIALSEKWNNDRANNYLILQAGINKYIISDDPNLEIPFFDISGVSILKAVPPIKTLWLYFGIRSQYDQKLVLNKQLASDAWLDVALHEMFEVERRRKELFQDFLFKNKTAIDKLRKSFAVANPLFIGGGADGAAFDIGNGKVLKLFQDDFAYQKTKEAFDRLHKNPASAKTEIMIYDVGILGKYMGFDNVYYSIMEKVSMLPKMEWAKIYTILKFVIDKIKEENKINSRWKFLKSSFNDKPDTSEALSKIIRNDAIKLANEFTKLRGKNFVEKIQAALPKLKSNWLEIYIEEIIMKYLTGRVDLHFGNLGITDYGELRYFDPAYSGIHSFTDEK